jgi:hypothetical protein
MLASFASRRRVPLAIKIIDNFYLDMCVSPGSQIPWPSSLPDLMHLNFVKDSVCLVFAALRNKQYRTFVRNLRMLSVT